MELKIYAEDPNKTYFAGLIQLEKEGEVKLDFINSRLFSMFYRFLKGRVLPKDFLKTFFAPLNLFFYKNLIVSTAPYGNKVYYFLLLKLLGKNLVYYNSWPYWNSPTHIKKPFLFGRFFWKLFLKGTKVATVTHFGVKEVSRLGARGYYKPQCIDTVFFRDKKRKRKKNVILFVGRLIMEKGILDLLEIASKLDGLEFWFVGDGPLKDKIKGKNVKYLGFRNKEELVEIYNQATIFVVNSHSTGKWEEWFGISLIEAMGCGLPVISTDCIGPMEIIKNGKNGFLVPQGNKEILSKRIGELIANDLLKKKFAEAGAKRVKEFDIKVVSRYWEKILKE